MKAGEHQAVRSGLESDHVGGSARIYTHPVMRWLRAEPKRSGKLPPSDEVETEVGRLLLPADDAIMRPMMAATGDWEANEAGLFRAFMRPGATVVDVGAHVGYYTLLAARSVGWHGRVIALEPDPVNAALLRENVRRNGLRNVAVLEAAAWHKTTRLRLRRNAVNTGDNRIAVDKIADAETCEVSAIRLDEVLGRIPITLVKVDAQGSDHFALQGMRETLQRDWPVVFVEFCPGDIRALDTDPGEVVDGYRELGYEISLIGFDGVGAWPTDEIVSAVEGYPHGVGVFVLRPSRVTLESRTAALNNMR